MKEIKLHKFLIELFDIKKIKGKNNVSLKINGPNGEIDYYKVVNRKVYINGYLNEPIIDNSFYIEKTKNSALNKYTIDDLYDVNSLTKKQLNKLYSYIGFYLKLA